MPATRKVLCTMAIGRHRELLEITQPAFDGYADRHGYDVIVLDRTLAPTRAPSWSKVPLLHDLVQRYDLALWVDCDAAIVDDSVDIADVLEPRAFLNLVEHRLPSGRVPNCGVIAMRGGARSRAFLDRVWRKTEYADHEWWENAAVLSLLGYRLQRPVRPVRPSPWRLGAGFLDRSWNSIPDDPAPRPRIAHFPGLPLADRAQQLRTAAAAAVASQPFATRFA